MPAAGLYPNIPFACGCWDRMIEGPVLESRCVLADRHTGRQTDLPYLRRLGLAAFIALRIVKSRRSPTLSLVTLISIAGIACGVMALTVVLGVTEGFQATFQERILGLYPHMVVLKRSSDFTEWPELLEDIRATPSVAGATPATYDDMMMAAGVARAGAIIKGIDLASVASVVDIPRLVRKGSMQGLAEAPHVTVQGDRLVLADAVAGTWLTVLVPPGPSAAPRVLHEDRTPPDAGNARVAVLDLRPSGAPLAVQLDPADVPRDDPDGGDPDDLEADSALPVPLGAATPGTLGPAFEVPAGEWRLTPTGQRLSLDPDTLVTLVLAPDPDEGGLVARPMVEPARSAGRERMAMVRVVDQRLAGPPLTLTRADGPTPLTPTAPGEHTSYQPVPARLPGILLGADLARRLEADVGTEVTLVTPLRGVDNKMMGPFGMAPSSVMHEVVGVFESGFYEYDVRLALVNIDAAQRFLNRGPVIRWIEVRSDDLVQVAQTKRRVAAAIDPYSLETLVASASELRRKVERVADGQVTGIHLERPAGFVGGLNNAVDMLGLLKFHEVDFGHRPTYRLIDWKEMNKNLFSALMMQEIILSIFFFIIVVVGCFVVVGSQIMVIHDKTPDIAILKAMGATGLVVRLVFTMQGLLVSGIGIVAGLLLGVGACAVIGAVDYQLDAAIYLIDRLPVQLEAVVLVVIAVGTLVCTLVATQYSAGRAAAKQPVQGLRMLD